MKMITSCHIFAHATTADLSWHVRNCGMIVSLGANLDVKICFNYELVNTLRPRQNGRHFPDDIYKWIFLNENLWISIKISLMVSLICARINAWVNNREAGDLRRYRAHYDVIVMFMRKFMWSSIRTHRILTLDSGKCLPSCNSIFCGSIGYEDITIIWNLFGVPFMTSLFCEQLDRCHAWGLV